MALQPVRSEWLILWTRARAFVFFILFHSNKDCRRFRWMWKVRDPVCSPGCCVASHTALPPDLQPFWVSLPVKEKNRYSPLSEGRMSLSFHMIAFHFPLAILCQRTALKEPPDGVKSPVYAYSRTHLIKSKGEHHWYCQIKHITQ